MRSSRKELTLLLAVFIAWVACIGWWFTEDTVLLNIAVSAVVYFLIELRFDRHSRPIYLKKERRYDMEDLLVQIGANLPIHPASYNLTLALEATTKNKEEVYVVRAAHLRKVS